MLNVKLQDNDIATHDRREKTISLAHV